MHWLLERRFFKDSDQSYTRLCENIVRHKVKHSFCTTIPFSDDGVILEEEISVNEPLFCFGSNTLCKIMLKRGYKPAAFYSSNSSMPNLLKMYGKEMLNSDMIFAPIGKLKPKKEPFFLRPAQDTKAFTSGLWSKDELIKFQESLSKLKDGEFSTVNLDTLAVCSSEKMIYAEYRYFIINGKIISSSKYKSHDRVTILPNVDGYIDSYVEKIIGIYQPEIAFCLDIAETPNGLKVIEVNCINCSGLYALDTNKFIFAVEELTEKYK